MQIEAFEPAGGTGAACTAVVAASVASASASLVDVVSRGTTGAANKCLIFNATTAIAFWRATKGASTAVNTDTPLPAGGYAAFKIRPDADTASVILSTSTGNVYFTLGEGM